MVIPSHEYPQRTYLSLSLFLSLFRLYVSPLTRRELTRARTRVPLAITREGTQGVADTRHLSHSIKA